MMKKLFLIIYLLIFILSCAHNVDFQIKRWARDGLGMIVYNSDGTSYSSTWGTGDMGQGPGALAWLTGDVDGDGDTDIIQPWKNGNRLGMIVYKSNGTSYSSTWGTGDMGQGPGALAWLTGDVDGDGDTDIIQPWKNGNRLGMIVYKSDGNSYSSTWGSGDLGQGPGALAWLTGDVDGDGDTDIIQPWKNDENLGMLLYISDGSGYSFSWGGNDIGPGPDAVMNHVIGNDRVKIDQKEKKQFRD